MTTWFVGPWELSRATAHLPPTPRDGRVLLVESTGKGSALPSPGSKMFVLSSTPPSKHRCVFVITEIALGDRPAHAPAQEWRPDRVAARPNGS